VDLPEIMRSRVSGIFPEELSVSNTSCCRDSDIVKECKYAQGDTKLSLIGVK